MNPDIPQFNQPELHKMRHDSHLHSGQASLKALTKVVDEQTQAAPEDHDIALIADNGLKVFDVRYFEPHTFVLCAHDEEGDAVYEVLHYSQLRVRIIHTPKKLPKRRVIGFRMG